MPLFQKNEDDKLIYIGGRFVPIMETITEGVTSVKMISRQDQGISKTPTGSTTYNWDAEDSQNQHDTELSSILEEELLCNQADAGSRTALIIKFKGDIDITVTPLLLETLQR